MMTRSALPHRAGLVTLISLLAACSLLNREGPGVSCADLQNGAENACLDGIVATCVNGTMRYKVCSGKSACGASWQTPGRFRCEESEALPVLTASDPDGGGSGSDGGTGPDGASSSDGPSATCSAPADQSCGAAGRRYCTDSHTWTDCLTEDKNCIESKSGGWATFADTSGGACSAKPSGAVVSCKACAGSVVCGQTSNCAMTGPVATACGKPGTVVREPNTAGGQTYCLAGGTFLNRGAASGSEITSGEVIPCPSGGKPADDVEACSGGPGSAEVCASCSGITWVRVCRTTGKWSGCNRGSL